MKEIERLPPPDCLNNDLPETRYEKRRFYKKLRDKRGQIYPRWNSTCKNEDGISRIRLRLLKMSDYCCVYCGKHLENSDMDVDHYLPSGTFPYLAYCWNNLLASCKYCNQNVKADCAPKSLDGKKIVEAFLADNYAHDYLYHKTSLLMKIAGNNRLIEPSFDNPEEHLEFNPEFFFYEAKTNLGQVTISKFFLHKEVAERWEQTSLFIKKLVVEDTPEEVVLDYISLHGYEYVCLKFYRYWSGEKTAGRINR